MVSLASREIWVSRATGESWDQQDPEERTVPRGPRVGPVSLETLVRLVPTERRVNLVSLGYLVTQGDKDQRGHKDSKVSLEPMERKERG